MLPHMHRLLSLQAQKMCRAVGNALHKNPNPDEIPCYRVVNAKGELSGLLPSAEPMNRLTV